MYIPPPPVTATPQQLRNLYYPMPPPKRRRVGSPEGSACVRSPSRGEQSPEGNPLPAPTAGMLERAGIG